MLVDDEEEIRDGIRRKIDWKGNGFELVASAGRRSSWPSSSTPTS